MMRLGGTHGLGFPASAVVSPPRSIKFRAKSASDSLNEYYTVLGLDNLASKADVKFAYKRLALKYHPDVIKGENVDGKHQTFREIKSAYESLMQKLEAEEELENSVEDYDNWEEWMGFEGGTPTTCSSC